MWQPAFVLAVELGFAGFLFYWTLLVIYRLSLHPLAKFPGPKITAVTKWYEFYFDVCKRGGGQFSWEIQKMHEKYGPIVRINPDELHIKDSSYFNTIYAPYPARRYKWPPAAQVTGSFDGSFDTIDHFLHKERRAANRPLFTSNSVTRFQPRVYECVKILCNALAERSERRDVIQLHKELLACTTDLMTSWILGKSWNCQTNSAIAEAWYATALCVPRITPLVKQFPWIVSLALKLPPLPIKIAIPDLAALVELRRRLYSESKQHAQRRSEGSMEAQGVNVKCESLPTLFDILDRSSLPPAEKSVYRHSQEAFVLIAAGTESTARTMTSCMFQLVSHPQVYARLREELIQVMPNPDSEPPLNRLESLPYLTAVLKENLRNMQLMTSRFPLQVPNDLDYGQWRIPKMVPVSMTITDMLLDENVFENPKSFNPERWLDSNGYLHNDYQTNFVPFGKGTRACQGQSVAWAVMYTCIARLVRRFEFSLFETTRARDFTVTRDLFLGFPCKESKGIRMTVMHDYAASA